MTVSNRVTAAQARLDQLTADFRAAELAASEAAGLRDVAPRAEKPAARVAATAAQQRKTDLKAQVEKAAAELKAAEKAAAAEGKKAAAARHHAAAETNPFLSDEINWPALGKWLGVRAADRVCYVEGAGWGEWTGSHWEFSVKPQASLLDRVRNAWNAAEGPVVEKLNANPKSAHYVLDHAQGALTLPRHLFNAPTVAHLVAFKNTTVDLRTGKRVPHDPKHYMTGALQCVYDEKAEFQRVVRSFARYWPQDPATAKMFQRAIGYSLTGETSAKRVFFMVGNQTNVLANGDNGKSLVQNALTRLFGLGVGGWGAAVKAALVVDTGDRDANSHDGAKVPLIWRRFAMASEFRLGASIDAGEFNRVSGGDVQSARPPHAERSVEFVNVASLWISMNSVPRFKTWDKATRVRLTPFPFTETFHDADTCPEGGQVKELGLAEWLGSDEGQAALALYAVNGAVEFYQLNGGKAGNIPDSPAVLALRDEILLDSNPYAEAFEDYFVFDPDWDLKSTAVSAVLMDSLGARPKPHELKAFTEALKGMGVMRVKVKGDWYFRGVRLTERGKHRMKQSNVVVPEHRRGQVVQIAAE